MKQSASKSNYYAYIYPWLVYLVDYEVLVMFEEELLLAKRNFMEYVSNIIYVT